MMDELLTDEQIAIKVIKLCIYQATTVQDSAWCVAHKSNWTTKNLVCDKYEDLLEAARAAVALTRQQIVESQEPASSVKAKKKSKRQNPEKLLKKAITDLEIAREISTHSFAPKYVKWSLGYLYEWQKIASTKKYNEDLRKDLASRARPLPIDYRLKKAISCLQNAQKSKDIDTCEHWVSAAIGSLLPILYSAETPEPQEKENEDD